MKWEGIKVKKWTVLERRIPIDCMDYCLHCGGWKKIIK